MNHLSSPPENRLSTAVIEAVAVEDGVDSLELSETLYDVLDPDALDALFAGRDNVDGSITFVYCGCELTVTAAGDVSLGR